MGEGAKEPLDFESFKDDIDPRSGYLGELACHPEDIQEELQEALDDEKASEHHRKALIKSHGKVYSSFSQTLHIPQDSAEWRADNPYPRERRSEWGNKLDDMLPTIAKWHTDDEKDITENMSAPEARSFLRQAKKFFVDQKGRLYKKATEEGAQHQLVVSPDRRMHMLHCAHDSLAHKGTFATREFLDRRFWWPDMESDVHWYVGSCIPCQNRQLRLLKIPPVVTHTPSLFQKVHVDTINITPASNRCKYIVHARDSLSSWSEARALPQENAKSLAEWFFDDIICRWGCPEEVVTDNAPVMLAMVIWLENKYGI